MVTGVSATGDREVLGVDVGDAEDSVFWTAFLKGLRSRGSGGVRLVVSDHHPEGAARQRCRVHFLRNALAKVPWTKAPMVAAGIRTIFAQPDRRHVHAQLHEVVTTLRGQFPEVADKLENAGEDLCAFASFPSPHWTKLWSTNPVERVNGEIKRRTNVVGIFPNDAGVLRLFTAVLVETHDEWTVAERRYLSEESMALLEAMCQRPRENPRRRPIELPTDGQRNSPGTASGIPQGRTGMSAPSTT